MRYVFFTITYFATNLLLANLTRMFESDFFKLPSHFYVYFLVTSAIYFLVYNFFPGIIVYALKDNFKIPILVQVMALLISTYIIGLLALAAGGAGDVKMGGVELVVNGKATLAYHLYNWFLVILPYLVTVYLIAFIAPAPSGE